MRVRNGVLALGLIVVAVLIAMALDDGRFWVRYIERIPATFKFPGASTALVVPPEQAVIKGAGGAGPVLASCDPGPQAGALRQADAWLAKHKTDAFLVWRDGCLIHEHYAKGDAATLWPVGPMAKTLVALTVGRAIKQGYISSVDEPMSDKIVEWKADGRRAITFRDMMGMHSGLSWYYQTQSPWGDFQRILYSSDYPKFAIRLPQVAAPGQYYDYSAWTYDLLGIALQHASGQRYEDLASALVAKPLGMDGARIYVDRPGGTVHANCCLWSTARDWIRLGALLVNESEHPNLLPVGFVDTLRTGRPDKPNYGLGMFLGSPYAMHHTVAGSKSGRPTPVVTQIYQSEPYAADDVLIFEGVDDNKAWVIPSRKLVILRLGSKAKGWDDAVVPNLLMSATS
jgi:CubicO group peptidase (beta-lactamase class C family)